MREGLAVMTVHGDGAPQLVDGNGLPTWLHEFITKPFVAIAKGPA
jgi:hypothetical protein